MALGPSELLAFVATGIMARVRAGDPPKPPGYDGHPGGGEDAPLPEPKPEVKEPEPEKTAEPEVKEPEPEEEDDTASLQRANRELHREVRELRETNRYLRHQMRLLHELHDRQWNSQMQAQQVALQAQALVNSPLLGELGDRAWSFCTCVPARADALRERRIVWPDKVPD